MSEQRTEVSINQLQQLTGKSYRTIVRRLTGLAPVRTDGRAIYYRPQVALPRILGDECAIGPTAEDVKRQVLHFEVYLSSRQPDDLFSWEEISSMLAIANADLEELVRHGCPYVSRGNLRTRKGWTFRLGHVIRWVPLWHSYLRERGLIAPEDDDLAAVTRGLRAERELRD